MLLVSFIWVLFAYHLIAALGAISITRNMRRQLSRDSRNYSSARLAQRQQLRWQLAGLGFHIVTTMWSGLLLFAFYSEGPA